MVSDNAATLHAGKAYSCLVLNFLARTSSLPYPRSIGNISEFGELPYLKSTILFEKSDDDTRSLPLSIDKYAVLDIPWWMLLDLLFRLISIIVIVGSY